MAVPPHRATVTTRRRRFDPIDCDADLVDRTRNGDRKAFAEMYRLTVDVVTRYIAVRMRDRDRDAIADLVHDAYCDALADPTLIQSDVAGSMLRLAARACTRHRWSTNRYVRAAYTVYQDQQSRNDPNPCDITQSAVVIRFTFVHAMARLTPDQRLAIQLRMLEGYPRDAAGKAMGKSAEAVRSLERRGLRQLQRQLAPPTTDAAIPAQIAERLTAPTRAVPAQ